MMVVMVMPVVVVMPVIVTMVVIMMVVVLRLETAHARAEGITKRAIGHIRSRSRSTLTFDVVVVAFLNRADLGLEADHLRAVFTQNTGRRRHIAERGVIACFDPAKTFRGLDVFMLTAFERKHLLAERANRTVRDNRFSVLLFDPLGKGFEHFGVIVEISRFDEMDIGVLRGDLIGKTIDTVDQDTSEQEIGENDNALVAELGHML